MTVCARTQREASQRHRGLIEKVTLTPRRFLAHAERLFELAPIRHVHFYRRNDITLQEVVELAESPWLGRLATFQLSSDRGIRDDSAGVLAASRRLGSAQSIRISLS